MLTHTQIWEGLDKLAARNNLSVSGLARLAGLDPTAFNKSKRAADDRKLHWPSTESIAKVLQATGSSLEDFAALVMRTDSCAPSRFIPLIGFAQAGSQGYFDDAGFPAGSGWEEIAFPEVGDPHAYALEIAGDSMLPIYRDGDRIIVSPSASVRRGDRVVVRTLKGEVMVKQLKRMSAHRVDLQSFNPRYDDLSFALSDLSFIHRIIWSSQ